MNNKDDYYFVGKLKKHQFALFVPTDLSENGKNEDTLKIERFAQRVKAMQARVADMYQSANTSYLSSDILPQAFMELSNASEMLELAAKELQKQNQELVKTRYLAEAECQHYRDLFQEAPDGYLVTDIKGIIQEANCAAAEMLGTPQSFLVGKLIASFVTLQDRKRFRDYLDQLF